MSKKQKKSNNDSGPGPEPDRLKIEGDWREAMRKGLKKKRPKEGWPEDKQEGDNSDK